jgi:Trk K+ transport system NAD-binding subunit
MEFQRRSSIQSKRTTATRDYFMPNVLIFGSDHLAFRIAEQLYSENCTVKFIATPGSWLANADLGEAKAVFCDERGEVVLLRAAGIDGIDTLFSVTDRDEANLGMALAALELNPRLSIVLRQFNVRLGRLLEQYLPQCEVLSMSMLAASTFALAAGSPGIRFAHHVGADTLVLRESSDDPKPSSGSKVIVAVDGEGVQWFPAADQLFSRDARLLIASTADELPSYPHLSGNTTANPPGLRWRSNRILLGVVAYLLIVVAFTSIYFSFRLHMPPLDAVYFVITTITSVGFGDFSLREADTLSKIVGILLMISGVGITAVFFALITNNLVAHQQAFDQGRVRQRISDHTIVCGLGVVGFRVAQSLHARGERVVCVEKDEDGRFVAEARHLHIPVVIGDALQEQTLRYANIAQARSLVVCSNPDHLNLEIALNGRSLHRDLPIVLRMFDPDLARRVARHFKLGTTFSSASLVAARFAAPAIGSTRLCNLQFENLSLDFHQVHVSTDDEIAKLRAKHAGRLVAAVDSEGRLRFDLENLGTFEFKSFIAVA